MAEKKDVDALINEADEILNGCKNNSIRDIFPKEIKVSGKSIKREENYEPELLDSVKYVIFDNLLKEPKNPLNIKIQPGEKTKYSSYGYFDIELFIDKKKTIGSRVNVSFYNHAKKLRYTHEGADFAKKLGVDYQKGEEQMAVKNVLQQTISEAEKEVKKFQDLVQKTQNNNILKNARVTIEDFNADRDDDNWEKKSDLMDFFLGKSYLLYNKMFDLAGKYESIELNGFMPDLKDYEGGEIAVLKKDLKHAISLNNKFLQCCSNNIKAINDFLQKIEQYK